MQAIKNLQEGNKIVRPKDGRRLRINKNATSNGKPLKSDENAKKQEEFWIKLTTVDQKQLSIDEQYGILSLLGQDHTLSQKKSTFSP